MSRKSYSKRVKTKSKSKSKYKSKSKSKSKKRYGGFPTDDTYLSDEYIGNFYILRDDEKINIVENTVNQINSLFETEPITYTDEDNDGNPVEKTVNLLPISFAIIPENLKSQFTNINKTYDEILNFKYKKWIRKTFFENIKLKSFKTDITNRIQYIDELVNSSWHREFCNPMLKQTIGLPLSRYITSDTHIVLYYSQLKNCKEKCGTRIKFYAQGNCHELTLPADDNIVYCLRDCYFAHISPTAIPEDETKEIERTIVRSYVTPEFLNWESSKCPRNMNMGISDWGYNDV
jgi:hypothetical protein